MGKWSIARIALTVFSSIGALFLLVTSMKFLFGWDWGQIFPAVVLLSVGGYLLIESQIKNVKTLKAQFGGFKKSFFGFMNTLMFGVGLVLLYIGATTLPVLSALSFSAPLFNGWIIFIGGLLAIGNIFNWI